METFSVIMHNIFIVVLKTGEMPYSAIQLNVNRGTSPGVPGIMKQYIIIIRERDKINVRVNLQRTTLAQRFSWNVSHAASE